MANADMVSPAPPLRLVLGSASPRRAALLSQLKLPFEQIASPEAEGLPGDSRPEVFAPAAAGVKARAVHRLLRDLGRDREPAIVIGADTVVCLRRSILGKPSGPEEASAMLSLLSGRTHRVYTGLCLIGAGGDELRDCVVTRVRMRRLTPAEIEAYVATGEPLDKAGAYGIQGMGARFIERIEGCYYNVVGLPLARLSSLLEQAGYRFAT
jgi:septum formation protein